MAIRTVIAVMVGGFLMACGGNTSDSRQTEQSSGMCPGTPTVLIGTGAAGSTCTTYLTCAPKCCSCAVGGDNYDAADCKDGACSDSPCEDNTTLCPP